MTQRPHDANARGRSPLPEFFTEIGIIAQLVDTAFDRMLPDGMSRAQFALLNHLIRLGGDHSLVDLARAFQVTKGAMTNTTGKLAAKGLIAVTPDPADGRGKRVSITDAGVAMRETCLMRVAPLFKEMTTDLAAEGLTPEGVAELIAPLRAIRRWLDANRPPAG